MRLFELAEDLNVGVAEAKRFLCSIGYIVKNDMDTVSPDAAARTRKELPAIVAAKKAEKEKKTAVRRAAQKKKRDAERKKKAAEKKKKDAEKKKREAEEQEKEAESKKREAKEKKLKAARKKKKDAEKKKAEEARKAAEKAARKKEEEERKKAKAARETAEKAARAARAAAKRTAKKAATKAAPKAAKKAVKTKAPAEAAAVAVAKPKKGKPAKAVKAGVAKGAAKAVKGARESEIELVPLERIRKTATRADEIKSSLEMAQSQSLTKRTRDDSAAPLHKGKKRREKAHFAGVQNRDALINRPRLSASAALRQTLTDRVARGQPAGGAGRSFRKRRHVHRATQKPIQQTREIHIETPISVRDFSQHVGVKVGDIIGRLMRQDIMATINASLDDDTVQLLSADLGLEITVSPKKEDLEDIAFAAEEEIEEVSGELAQRMPVVTFMGHVDHGKTSLLDAIRQTNVVASESGGITQHIGASEVAFRDGWITFIDTPGHEAFTTMRARGALVTDLAVLVVAADDGLMPQSLEAIDHARAANVPILVAINKTDLAGADPDRVMRQLAERELAPEDWGGETICCKVSALTKEGIGDLLEMIFLQAEVLELEARPTGPADGVVLEANLDSGKGATVTLLVQNGLLKKGAPIVCGSCFGRARALLSPKGQPIDEAGPSRSVQVLGFSEVPIPGSKFRVAKDERHARELAESRRVEEQLKRHAEAKRVTLENFYRRLSQQDIKELPIVIKGDTQGTTEVVRSAIERLSTAEVRVRVLHSGVGDVTDNDIMLASASDAIVLGFKVDVSESARGLVKSEGVEVKLYDVIYHATEQIERALVGLLEPVYKEVITGGVEVRQVFNLSSGVVAGCYVTNGAVGRNDRARVLRGDGEQVFDGVIQSLKRMKDEVKDVRAGLECGILLRDFSDVQEGDRIETYKLEEQTPELTRANSSSPQE